MKFFLSTSVVQDSVAARAEDFSLIDYYNNIGTTPNLDDSLIPYPPSNGDLLEVYLLSRDRTGERHPFSDEAIAFRYFESGTGRKREVWAVSFSFRPVGEGNGGRGKIHVEVHAAPFDGEADGGTPFAANGWTDASYLGPVTGSVYSMFVDEALAFQDNDEGVGYSPFVFDDSVAIDHRTTYDYVDNSLKEMAEMYVAFRPPLPIIRVKYERQAKLET